MGHKISKLQILFGKIDATIKQQRYRHKRKRHRVEFLKQFPYLLALGGKQWHEKQNEK
jgi:uncharacterized membrane protein YsdA (DUF1294 family)